MKKKQEKKVKKLLKKAMNHFTRCIDNLELGLVGDRILTYTINGIKIKIDIDYDEVLNTHS